MSEGTKISYKVGGVRIDPETIRGDSSNHGFVVARDSFDKKPVMPLSIYVAPSRNSEICDEFGIRNESLVVGAGAFYINDNGELAMYHGSVGELGSGWVPGGIPRRVALRFGELVKPTIEEVIGMNLKGVVPEEEHIVGDYNFGIECDLSSFWYRLAIGSEALNEAFKEIETN